MIHRIVQKFSDVVHSDLKLESVLFYEKNEVAFANMLNRGEDLWARSSPRKTEIKR